MALTATARRPTGRSEQYAGPTSRLAYRRSPQGRRSAITARRTAKRQGATSPRTCASRTTTGPGRSPIPNSASSCCAVSPPSPQVASYRSQPSTGQPASPGSGQDDCSPGPGAVGSVHVVVIVGGGPGGPGDGGLGVAQAGCDLGGDELVLGVALAVRALLGTLLQAPGYNGPVPGAQEGGDVFGHGAPGGHVEVGNGLLGGFAVLVPGEREADDAPAPLTLRNPGSRVRLPAMVRVLIWSGVLSGCRG